MLASEHLCACASSNAIAPSNQATYKGHLSVACWYETPDSFHSGKQHGLSYANAVTVADFLIVRASLTSYALHS